MRVALFDYSLFFESLGLSNLMGVLKVKKHDYRLFIISEEKDILKSVRNFNPDFLCFSTCTGTHHISFRLARHLKKYMDVITVFGGPHVTLFPEECIREDCVDILCRGEGEEALIELLSVLEKKVGYTNIKNLWVKKDGKVIKNPIRQVVDVNSLPTPDYSLFDAKRLYRPMAGKVYRMVPIETHRGCPYLCAFCNSPVTNKFYKKY